MVVKIMILSSGHLVPLKGSRRMTCIADLETSLGWAHSSSAPPKMAALAYLAYLVQGAAPCNEHVTSYSRRERWSPPYGADFNKTPESYSKCSMECQNHDQYLAAFGAKWPIPPAACTAQCSSRATAGHSKWLPRVTVAEVWLQHQLESFNTRTSASPLTVPSVTRPSNCSQNHEGVLDPEKASFYPCGQQPRPS